MALRFIMNGSSAATLNVRLGVKRISSTNLPRAKEGTLRTYLKEANYLLPAHGADYVIVKSDAASTRCTEPSAISLKKYADMLVTRLLNCGEVYDE